MQGSILTISKQGVELLAYVLQIWPYYTVYFLGLLVYIKETRQPAICPMDIFQPILRTLGFLPSWFFNHLPKFSFFFYPRVIIITLFNLMFLISVWSELRFGPVNLFWSTRYDKAMTLFLACIKEFADFARAKDRAANLPAEMCFQLPYKYVFLSCQNLFEHYHTRWFQFLDEK